MSVYSLDYVVTDLFKKGKKKNMKSTAVVYCENEFGNINGKVANGLIRYSQKYDIVGVIDSTKSGQDSGDVLDSKSNGIPIFKNIETALEELIIQPKYFIYGLAPSKTILNQEERLIFFEAMKLGMDIVNGLPQFFKEDKEFVEYANNYGVTILDIRKPPDREMLHHFTGRIHDVNTPVITILGTDCAVGKRTTAQKLVAAFKEEGLIAAFIATGQTGLLQGAKYGVAIDMLSSGFATGEVENAILEADEGEFHDLIIVEGQGSLAHPSFTSSSAILKGSLPDAIIVQHAPKRRNYCTYPDIPITSLQAEIDLIEEFAGPYVMAIAINHEDMSEKEIDSTIEKYEETFQLPATDVLTYGCEKLVNKICHLFPELQRLRNPII